VKRHYSIGLTVIGVLACAYTVYRDSHPESPAIHLWVILLVLTWALLGYNVYLRRFRPRPVDTNGVGMEWRAGFSQPRFEIVNDHRFENEEIVVDNKSFRRCSFKNVKLLFHGHAPFEFVEGTTIDKGTVFFTTDDPAIMAFNTIQRKFASLPGAHIQHGALDGQGKEIALSPLTVEPLPSWVRFLTAYPEIVGPPAPGKEPAKKPQKVRCEFLNCTESSYKVKVISWDPVTLMGLDADFWRGCLQLRIGTTWCPEWNGVEELNVPSRESFRLWLFPKATFSDDQFKTRVNLGNLGTVHLLINGKEVAVSVG
jgi:hypothetical protein